MLKCELLRFEFVCVLTLVSDVKAPPQQIVQQILSIAPILREQEQRQLSQPQGQPDRSDNATPRPPPTQRQPPPPPQQQQNTSLVDLDPHRPQGSNTAQPDPIAGNPLHPTSNPKQIPGSAPTAQVPLTGNSRASGGLMDDDRHLNQQMGNMSLHQPLTPSGQSKPLQRTDTETSETDVFVDAES